jgi:hypothetical protein
VCKYFSSELLSHLGHEFSLHSCPNRCTAMCFEIVVFLTILDWLESRSSLRSLRIADFENLVSREEFLRFFLRVLGFLFVFLCG